MNNYATLSIAPYYGGKGRMAHFIANRLNYDDSDVFLTPFGGLCRVLLNKPRHQVECYNDYSSGLTALMEVLSDRDSADELIHRLYDETEYSQEEFDRQKAIFDNAEIDLEQQERGKLKKLLVSEKVVSAVTANELLNVIIYDATHPDVSKDINNIKLYHSDISKTVLKSLVALKDCLSSDEKFRIAFEKQLNQWSPLYQMKLNEGYIRRTQDIGENVTDIDLAMATYYVFQCSRDGMGQAFSDRKFKGTRQYLNRVMNLYKCAERLDGVQVYQIDAVEFFRQRMFVDVDTSIENVPPQFRIMNEWINEPKVMMCCDPSYISVESERELLEGIDIEKTKNLSEAIKVKYDGKKMPKNLGKVYARSFGYDEQEKFLRCIQKARCRILVCNYDLELYNKYLNENTGWRREEFFTTTGVGGKANNTRTEVIWYNY